MTTSTDPVSSPATRTDGAPHSFTIRQKQLVTLASAIGILACGACFAPSHYKPPPPPPIAAEGITSLRVAVIDESDPKRLNLPALEGVILSSFHRFDESTKIFVYSQEKAASEVDAILEVRILSLSAVHDPGAGAPAEQKWTFSVTTSATLRRPNGDAIWRSRSDTFTPHFESYTGDEENMWRDPIIQSALIKAIGNRFCAQAVYQFPQVTIKQDLTPSSEP